jgi:hypothetical protein
MPSFRSVVALCLIAACGEPSSSMTSDAATGPDARAPGPFDGMNVEYVGHAALDDDANLGLALAGNYAFVGHRLDGKIDIVDIADPTAPERVGELAGDFDATEVRAIEDLRRLYVLSYGGKLTVFDLTTPTAPALLGSFLLPNSIGHEFYLWRDPQLPTRVLAFVSDVSTSGGFFVLDVSDPAAITLRFRQTGGAMHSVALSADGTRLYASYISGAFRIIDSSTIIGTGTAAAPAITQTPLVDCSYTSPSCIAHSAVEVPGRKLAVVTYENAMCPKGWMNIVDTSDETAPRKVGSWKHPRSNECDQNTHIGKFGYGPHNPTVTANLALVSWYRAGFLIFDLTDPATPVEVGRFQRRVTEGSRHEWGSVASVSYPIVKRGLIYVVDGRNGLDILRYTGPHRDELDDVDFLEGNSNL